MAAAPMPTSYMSVKEAIREQEMARLFNRQNRPATVRLPPTWSEVHARDPLQHMQRSSPTGKVGFPRAEDGLLQPSVITASATSSVAHGPPGSPASNRVPDRSALGGSSKSGLNHTSTYFYGEAPLKPDMCDRNQYNMVGSYSMFGSQVRARARRSPPTRWVLHRMFAARWHMLQRKASVLSSRPPWPRQRTQLRTPPLWLQTDGRGAA